MKGLAVAVPFLALLLGLREAAFAQEPEPEESRFRYGGEVAFNLAPVDPEYFNQTDYGDDSLRLFRLNLALELRASNELALLTEIRSDNLDAPRAYALYARFRPWRERAFAVQVGKVPPVFGAFLRRRYEYDNPLIGHPIPYEYATVLRPDSAPASLQQLLYYRGYGARVRYPIGDTSVASGLAQVSPLRWDTGVTVSLGSDPVALAVALTQGTISSISSGPRGRRAPPSCRRGIPSSRAAKASALPRSRPTLADALCVDAGIGILEGLDHLPEDLKQLGGLRLVGHPSPMGGDDCAPVGLSDVEEPILLGPRPGEDVEVRNGVSGSGASHPFGFEANRWITTSEAAPFMWRRRWSGESPARTTKVTGSSVTVNVTSPWLPVSPCRVAVNEGRQLIAVTS